MENGDDDEYDEMRTRTRMRTLGWYVEWAK